MVMAQEALPLSTHLRYLEDPSGVLSAERVASQIDSFQKSNRDIPNFGFSSSTYWFVVQLENRTNFSKWVLEAAYPSLDYVDFYIVSPAGVPRLLQQSGDRRPFENRHIDYRHANSSLDLLPGTVARLLLRVQTEGSVQVPLNIYTEHAFANRMTREHLVLGSYYGLMLVMALFNFFVCVSLKDRSYLYYVFFLVSFLMAQLSLNGVAFQVLWPTAMGIANGTLVCSLLLASGFGALFAHRFLKFQGPQFPNLLMALGVLFLTTAVLSPFLSYGLGVRLASVAAVVLLVTQAIAGTVSVRHGFRPARYFLGAWSLFIVGGVVYGIKAAGVLPATFATNYAVQIGSAAMVVLLSFALGDRINLLQLEKLSVQTDLATSRDELVQQLLQQEELQSENVGLTRDVAVATDRLIGAEKMATLGELVASIAHDFANPIGSISVGRSVIGEQVEDLDKFLNSLLEDEEEATELLEMLNTRFEQLDKSLANLDPALRSLKNLQKAMRNYSHDSTHLAPAVSLLAMLQDVTTIVRFRCGRHQLDSAIPDELRLDCYPGQLGQVMANLMVNAADALDEKAQRLGGEFQGGVIRVSGHQETAATSGEDFVVICVEDNGDGLPDEIIPKVKQSFFTTKSRGKGSGLGLSICTKIIDKHRGSLEIGRSKSLGGARFVVRIPGNLAQLETPALQFVAGESGAGV